MSVMACGDYYELAVRGVPAGTLRFVRGFAVVQLVPLSRSSAQTLREAVELAVDRAAFSGVHGILVTVHGEAPFLGEMGFEVSEAEGPFRPQLWNRRTGRTMRLPYAGPGILVHNGHTWRFASTLTKVRGRWPQLGFLAYVNPEARCLSVDESFNGSVVVNGARIDEKTYLVDEDVIQHGDRDPLVYRTGPSGRAALADFYLEFTGCGGANPAYTRAVRMLRSS